MEKKNIVLGLTAGLSATILFGCGTQTSNYDDNTEETVTMQVTQPVTEKILVSSTLPVTTCTTTIATTTNVTTTTPVTTTQVTTTTEETRLNSVQENSISWLNYLAMLTQEINSSKNSKMFLEEAYAALINNSDPENVNELTESHLVSLLDIIEKYRMIAVKRERLQLIYEQNKARAIKEAVPNPVALLSATSSLDPKKLVASVVYMAVDSYNSYTSYKNELEQEFLKDGWELDDEAAENLHDSRKRAFTFMLDIVRENDLPGELALNENAVEQFVKCKNNTNVHQKIQFLENAEGTYNKFGNYWLLLAECYYENNEYKKCLNAIDEYEELHNDIFRKDYYYAKTLPVAIASVSEVKSGKNYISQTEYYLEKLIDNAEDDNWSLRYFAAEMYVDLYTRTKDTEYLDAAYDILLNNINFLVENQKEINTVYLSEVKEMSIPDTASKEEKKKIKDYNKELKNRRETELPELYEPLAVNCDLLFSIADKISLSKSAKDRVNGILADAFLTNSVNEMFSFGSVISSDIDGEYNKNKIILPVSALSDGATVKVTVTNGSAKTVYDDWIIDKVSRTDENINNFKVILTSKNAKKQEWTPESTVSVEIVNTDYSRDVPIILNYKVVDYKDIKVLPDSFDFEQVK